MEKYTFEFAVETGHDYHLPEFIKDENAAAAFVDRYIQADDFGEFFYNKHSKPEIMQNEDGSSYAHIRLYGSYITTQIGFDKKECRDKAQAAFESADFGSLCIKGENGSYVIDETFTGRIIEETAEAFSYMRVISLVENAFHKMNSKESQTGISIPSHFYASNMDNTGISIEAKIIDSVEKTVNYTVYKAKNEDDKVSVLSEGAKAPDSEVLYNFKNVPDYTFASILESVVTGNTDSVLQGQKERISSDISNKILSLSENDIVIFHSSIEDINYSLMVMKHADGISITLANNNKEIGHTEVFEPADFHIDYTKLETNEMLPLTFESREGTFETSIRKAIMQDYLETQICDNWKDEVIIDVTPDVSYRIVANLEDNTCSAMRMKGRIITDEETIISSKQHEPTSQDITCKTMREIVDFICKDRYAARQGVREYNERNAEKCKGHSEKKKTIEPECG